MSRTKQLRTVGGVALIASGTALLVLPGPGLALITAGITLLPDGKRKLERVRAIAEPALQVLVALRAAKARRASRARGAPPSP